MTTAQKIKDLREQADRLESIAYGGNCSPSSQEWLSYERQQHVLSQAQAIRDKADKLEKGGG